MRVVQQVKGGKEEVQAGLHVAGTAQELRLDAGAIFAQSDDPLVQLLFGPRRVAHQVKVVILLGLDVGELPFELLPKGGTGGTALGGCLAHDTRRLVAEVVRQADGRIVGEHGAFDVLNLQIGQVADPFLPSPADVVVVLDSEPAPAGHDHETGLAAPTPDHTAEVVIVGAFPFARAPVAVEYTLHPVKQVLRDQRLVTALVLDAAPLHIAEVVALAEHVAEEVDRDRASTTLAVRLGG
ncbi:hypothetical protein RB614_00975 [Phytohabitans sp. ZYX-F-186]|uniref:Uncharacterized protein n=1 Tax=Phytohabitans maris TaxID=3071409 RepID=A0ABU0Z7Q5_9ACTN|nr:hypothetical protein [Phytohabitans sp. ZYX-F-186]MDQ7903093.1 hypothetical protein [Phytohabitans sp. ZYX-F-186]